MIRKLTEADRQSLLDFVSKEASINLFIIGDVKNFGFDHPKQTLWAQFDDTGNYIGVLLKYRANFIPYYNTDKFPGDCYDISGFLEIMNLHQGEMMVSGKRIIIERFYQALDNFTIKYQYFCEILSLDDLVNSEDSTIEIKKAIPEDDERIFNLISNIEEFSQFANRIGNYAEKISDGSGRIYYVEEEGKMVTVTQTTAENQYSAMVVGVATLTQARGKGYMSACLTKMCKDLLSEKKSLCLFYDNPKAGSIYHRLGFKSIDKWAMMSRK